MATHSEPEAKRVCQGTCSTTSIAPGVAAKLTTGNIEGLRDLPQELQNVAPNQLKAHLPLDPTGVSAKFQQSTFATVMRQLLFATRLEFVGDGIWRLVEEFCSRHPEIYCRPAFRCGEEPNIFIARTGHAFDMGACMDLVDLLLGEGDWTLCLWEDHISSQFGFFLQGGDQGTLIPFVPPTAEVTAFGRAIAELTRKALTVQLSYIQQQELHNVFKDIVSNPAINTED
jgi:hypothetical protein